MRRNRNRCAMDACFFEALESRTLLSASPSAVVAEGPADAGFAGGVRVAVGDVNNDGSPDVIVAAGASLSFVLGDGSVRVAAAPGRTHSVDKDETITIHQNRTELAPAEGEYVLTAVAHSAADRPGGASDSIWIDLGYPAASGQGHEPGLLVQRGNSEASVWITVGFFEVKEATKGEMFDYPGEYAQRFDGLDKGGNPHVNPGAFQIISAGKDG